MGQFLDYLAAVFTGNKEVEGSTSGANTSATTVASSKANQHVTFADSSLGQIFNRSNSAAAEKVASLTQTNRRTIYLFQSIGAIAFLAHLSTVAVPRIQSESFDLFEPDGWQLITLSLIPLFVQVASIYAMHQINQPISEGTKLSAKNSGLNLNENKFAQSLKIVIILMAACQISTIFSHQFIWSAVMIVPIWCYLLTTRVAQAEYMRFAPSPKKQWVTKLNLSRSPKNSPIRNKQESYSDEAAAAKAENSNQTRATPRTRTKRAVKNIISGVSDKYHALEQNVAHQFSQKIFTPLSPKMKAIE